MDKILERIEAAASGYKELIVQAGLCRKTLYENRMSLDEKKRTSLCIPKDLDSPLPKTSEETRRFSDIIPLIESAKRTLTLAKQTDQTITDTFQNNLNLEPKLPMIDDSSSDEGKNKKVIFFNNMDEKNSKDKQNIKSSNVST